MNEQLQVIYQHDPNIISRLIAGEVILVPIRKNVGEIDNIYTLNETGARIWELIDGRRSLAEILQKIVQEFEVPVFQAEQDLLELIGVLLAEGAVVQC